MNLENVVYALPQPAAELASVLRLLSVDYCIVQSEQCLFWPDHSPLTTATGTGTSWL